MTVTVTDIPYQPDSSSIFRAIADEDWPVWLDSGGSFPGHHVDILAANPVEKLVYDPSRTLAEPATTLRTVGSIDEAFSRIQKKLQDAAHLQTHGPGWLGYLSYDLFDDFEAIKKRPKPELIPAIAMGFYATVVINDHQQKRTWICHLQEQVTWATILADRLQRTDPDRFVLPDFHLESKFSPLTPRASYSQQFNRVKNYILEGDCYQVNLTQRFSATCSGGAVKPYLALRQAHPSPMSCYFSTGDFEILSLSPERFIQSHGDRIASYPVKGTRPRSTDNVKDRELKEALQSSLKDRAENVMIVDLLRNDLGRICRTGSVETTQLFAVESFPNVHHLVSTIEGSLKPGMTLQEIFRATFPGGSITGAPKVRAMEIIEELEDHRRSIYCGSVVYFCGNGDMDSNIAIRTLLRKDDEIHVWGGGGLVVDSSCADEYEETLHKVGKLMAIMESGFLR